MQQGGSTNVTVTVAGAGGFTAIPAVTISGVPTGVTGTVSNISTSGSTSTGTVTLNVAATTAVGVYPITVNVAGTGVTAVTATFTLTVTAAPVPAYTLSATPAGSCA